ncbi:MAG: CPBP family intramembrane glutamic endopeptidase [Chitinophagales bacterium]
MNPTEISRPSIKQGWLRVILFFVVYFFALIALAVPAGLLLGWIKSAEIAQGEKIKTGELLSGEYLWLISLVSLLATLLVVFIFRRLVDRKSMVSLGLRFRNHLNDAGAGFFLGPAILGIGTLALYFTKHLSWNDIIFDPIDLLIGFGTMVLIAIGEELAFRGYILNNLLDSFNKWIALFITSLLFSLFHLGNSFIGFIPLVNIFLAGILLGINYIYTRNLWFGVFLHFSWNFFQGPLLGYKVSGIGLGSLIQTELKGGPLVTGGEFGFEGSIIDLALTLIAILILFLVYERKYSDAASMKPIVPAGA